MESVHPFMVVPRLYSVLMGTPCTPISLRVLRGHASAADLVVVVIAVDDEIPCHLHVESLNEVKQSNVLSRLPLQCDDSLDTEITSTRQGRLWEDSVGKVVNRHNIHPSTKLNASLVLTSLL